MEVVTLHAKRPTSEIEAMTVKFDPEKPHTGYKILKRKIIEKGGDNQ